MLVKFYPHHFYRIVSNSIVQKYKVSKELVKIAPSRFWHKLIKTVKDKNYNYVDIVRLHGNSIHLIGDKSTDINERQRQQEKGENWHLSIKNNQFLVLLRRRKQKNKGDLIREYYLPLNEIHEIVIDYGE